MSKFDVVEAVTAMKYVLCAVQDKEQHHSLVVLLEKTHFQLMQYMRSAKEQAGTGVVNFMHTLRAIRLPQV